MFFESFSVLQTIYPCLFSVFIKNNQRYGKRRPYRKTRKDTNGAVNNYFDVFAHFKQKRNIGDIKDTNMGELTLFLVFGLLLNYVFTYDLGYTSYSKATI